MPEHGMKKAYPDTSRGYEQSDLSLIGISRGVVFYFIFTALIGAFVYFMFLVFHQAQPYIEPFNQFPQQPYPLLQNNITDRTDIWNLRAKEDFLLHNYTYVDKPGGIVRVPIDRALDQAAAQGPAALATAPPGPLEQQQIATPSGLPAPPVSMRRPANNEFAGEKTAPKKKPGMPPPLQGHLKIPTGAGGP